MSTSTAGAASPGPWRCRVSLALRLRDVRGDRRPGSEPPAVLSLTSTAVAVASPSATAAGHRPCASAADLAWKLVDLPDSGGVGADRRRRRAAGRGRRRRRRRGGRRTRASPGRRADDGATWASEPLPGTAHAIGHSDRVGRSRPDPRRGRRRLRASGGHRDLDPRCRRRLGGRAVRSDPVRRWHRPGCDARATTR